VAAGQFRLQGQHLWVGGPTRWGLVFCSSPRLFHRDSKLLVHLSGLGTVSELHRDPWLRGHLPGLAKNAAPRRRRHLIKPPGRYGQCGTILDIQSQDLFNMKTILLATIIFVLPVQSSLKEPPNKVSKAFKQKFPSAMNSQWIEEGNITRGTYNFMGKIYKSVQDHPNTWKVNFLLGNRKTLATFDLEGHWIEAQQEIKLEEIVNEEVSSAIKKDYHGCEIQTVKIYNSASLGTWYEVEGICGNTPKAKFYDYMGLPFPPKI